MRVLHACGTLRCASFPWCIAPSHFVLADIMSELANSVARHLRLVTFALFCRPLVSPPTAPLAAREVRIGGTACGGGTFLGLARALTSARTFDEVVIAQHSESVSSCGGAGRYCRRTVHRTACVVATPHGDDGQGHVALIGIDFRTKRADPPRRQDGFAANTHNPCRHRQARLGRPGELAWNRLACGQLACGGPLGPRKAYSVGSDRQQVVALAVVGPPS